MAFHDLSGFDLSREDRFVDREDVGAEMSIIEMDNEDESCS